MTAPAARTLLTKLHAHGWHARLVEGEGTVDVSSYGEERPDGTHPLVTEAVPCRSVGVSATHPDGRALVVAWETHSTTTAGAPSWKRVIAWRRRHDDEGAPAPLKAADIDAYVTQAAAELEGAA